MSTNQTTTICPYSEELERKVIAALNETNPKNCSKETVKVLNLLKRKWRDVKYPQSPESIPTMIRPYPGDILSSMGVCQKMHEKTIHELINCRYSIQDRYRTMDEKRLVRELKHSRSLLRSVIRSKETLCGTTAAAAAANTTDQSVSGHECGVLEVVSLAAANVRMKYQVLQKLKTMSTTIPPPSVLVHRTKPITNSCRPSTTPCSNHQTIDCESEVLRDVTMLSQFPGFSSTKQ